MVGRNGVVGSAGQSRISDVGHDLDGGLDRFHQHHHTCHLGLGSFLQRLDLESFDATGHAAAGDSSAHGNRYLYGNGHVWAGDVDRELGFHTARVRPQHCPLVRTKPNLIEQSASSTYRDESVTASG